MKTLILLISIIFISCEDSGSSGEASASLGKSTPAEVSFDNGEEIVTVILEPGFYESECFMKNGELHGYKFSIDNSYNLTIMDYKSTEAAGCNAYEHMIAAKYTINGDSLDFVETSLFTETSSVCGVPIENFEQNIDGINCHESYENKTTQFIQEENGDVTFNGIKINL